MNRLWKCSADVWVAALALGCEDPGSVEGERDLVTVTGVVTMKDDQVPVDGGVTMTLQLDDGGAETLVFRSLFTAPPPPPEQLALYQVIAQVRVGDRVRAEGRRRDDGVELEDLTILKDAAPLR